MSKISIQQIDMFSSPNYFAPIPMWEIQDGNPATLNFMLTITDANGTRRYLPPTNTAVQLQFQRARPTTIGSTVGNQTFNVTANVNPYDTSLYSVALGSDQVSLLTSGTVLILLSGGQTLTIVKNYAIKKSLTSGSC